MQKRSQILSFALKIKLLPVLLVISIFLFFVGGNEFVPFIFGMLGISFIANGLIAVKIIQIRTIPTRALLSQKIGGREAKFLGYMYIIFGIILIFLALATALGYLQLNPRRFS